MITTDNEHTINGVVYRRTVSDAGFMIRKVGTDEVYAEAVDVLTATWAYEETDIPIPAPVEPESADAPEFMPQ